MDTMYMISVCSFVQVPALRAWIKSGGRWGVKYISDY